MADPQINSVVDAFESLEVEDTATANELDKLTIETIELLEELDKDGVGTSTMDFDPELDVEGQQFNLELYQKAFKTICRDYGDELKKDSKSRAFEFCSKIIYEVGPEAHRVKKAGLYKEWKFGFQYTDETIKSDGEKSLKPVTGYVTVVTFLKDRKVPLPTEGSLELVLTVKQAQLIAMVPFCELTSVFHAEVNRILLTPLAGAQYAPKDMVSIAADLKLTVGEVLKIVNCSAYSGGQYTEHGSLNCALVIATLATRSMEQNARKRLLHKIFRRYRAANKSYDISVLNVYAKHAINIPPFLSPENLIKLFNEIHRAKTQ